MFRALKCLYFFKTQTVQEMSFSLFNIIHDHQRGGYNLQGQWLGEKFTA